MSELIRSFIAVAIPPESSEAIRRAQQRLKEADGGWKWVDADNFHITLKFLGDVQRDKLDSLWQGVTGALEGALAFTAKFRGVGVFPNPSRARVVWAGIEHGATELAELAARIEEAGVRHGFEREKRPFRAHLTLGRARRPGPNPVLAAAMEDFKGADLGETRMDRVLLMKSDLRPTGPIYTVLEEQPLAEGESR